MTMLVVRGGLPAVLMGLVGLAGVAVAAPYRTTVVEYPGAISTYPMGQNAGGTVVGVWTDKRYAQHGFVYMGGRLVDFNPPGAISATPTGINVRGDIVGYYVDVGHVTHGFLYTAMTRAFGAVDLPGSAYTTLNGINRNGLAVGTGLDGGGNQEVFTYQRGVFTPAVDNQQSPSATAINHLGTITGFLAPPRSREMSFTVTSGVFALVPFGGDFFSAAFAINEHNETAGQFVDGTGAEFGFVYTPGGAITTVQPPGSTDAFFTGINDQGIAAGVAYDPQFNSAAWIYDTHRGRSVTFLISGYSQVGATGINDAGQVIGDCEDAAGVGCTFVALPGR